MAKAVKSGIAFVFKLVSLFFCFVFFVYYKYVFIDFFFFICTVVQLLFSFVLYVFNYFLGVCVCVFFFVFCFFHSMNPMYILLHMSLSFGCNNFFHRFTIQISKLLCELLQRPMESDVLIYHRQEKCIKLNNSNIYGLL